MRLVTVLSAHERVERFPRVRHYVGFPPHLGGVDGEIQRTKLPGADVLMIEAREDGFFLFRFTRAGDFAGDTWHLSLDDAKHQAGFEFGDDFGEWIEVPDSETDPVRFALDAKARRSAT